MIFMVIKRDGRKVEFDKSKIENAILKAFDACNCLGSAARAEAEFIANKCYENFSDYDISVEEIQDEVEYYLMKNRFYHVAKEYITYRYKRAVARDKYKEFTDAMSEKLGAKNVENQNANVDERSFGGRMGEATRVMTKQFALENILSPMARANHEGNRIYIHDLDNYAVGNHNCLSVPFDDLLAKGFNTRQTDVRPAQSINTAFQLVAVIFQLQSLQQFGGVSATHLDWTMVPYVRKSFYKHFKDGIVYVENVIFPDDVWDKRFNNEMSIEDPEYKKFDKAYHYALVMTRRETMQAVEGMYHNLNTLQSRSGNQLPFTSINYGTCTLPEGRMVTEMVLTVSINGIGKLHKTSIFPCGIMVMKKGVNRKPGDPNYDLFMLALRSTAQRLYPNYANGDFSAQIDWVKYDRDNKKKIIESLTDEEQQKLIERLEKNPELKDILMLDIVEE